MFSRAVGREEHCKQISLACVGSARSVLATLGLLPLMVCVLRLQVALQGTCLKWALDCVHFPDLHHSGSGSWVLHKGTDSVGLCFVLAFCALPMSEELRQPGVLQAHSPSWAVGLITSPVPAPGFPGCTTRMLCQVCRVSPLGS